MSNDKNKLGQVHPAPIGWNNQQTKRTSVDPAAVEQLVKSKKRAGKIWRPKSATATLGTKGGTRTGVKSLSAGFATNTVSSPNSIPVLARSLKNDVDLIFEHVYNNVETSITWGLQKGGQGALIDCYGNSFEQADAFVKLCREAGYDAEYVFGQLEMPEADVNAWLGTTSIWAAYNLLSNGGIAAGANWSWPAGYSLYFSHCWARVYIGGTWYHFDPTIKSYSAKSPIDLADAIDYDAGEFMTDAMDGATDTGDYIQDINRTNIRANLSSMTDNLVQHIKDNFAGAASVDDILGGRTIVAQSGQVRNTAHPHLKVGTTPTIWSTDIDDDYKCVMQVQYDWNGSGFNIDESFFSADIYGLRMTLFFNGSRQAELRVDGDLVATSSAQGIGTWNSILVTASHPAPADWTSQYAWFRVWAEKPYIIANVWGSSSGRGMMEVHRMKLAERQFAGASASAEDVLGSALNVMFFTAVAEGNANAEMINRITGCKTIQNHAIGLVGHYDTPLFDIGMVSQISTPLDNDYSRLPHNNTAIAMHGVANECGAIQQMAGIGGVSTTPLVDQSAANGMKIYDGTSSNWSTDVEPNLTNYDSGVLNDIETWYINNGHRVILPEDGDLTKNSWQGYGYFVFPYQSGCFGIIGGGLKGGGGDETISIGNYNGALRGNGVKPGSDLLPTCATRSAGDPIDFGSGRMTHHNVDLRVGSQSFPFGLTFEREYNSANRMSNGSLGLGWEHNWSKHIAVNSDGLMGMGEFSAMAGAAAIVEMFVCVNLLSDTGQPFDKWLTCALANQWLTDNLTDNTVIVSAVRENEVFVKLPSGQYVAPQRSSATLTKNLDGTYTYTTPQKVEYNYNSANALATIVFPFGMTVTLTYDTGKLVSVSNGQGRELTITYDGNKIDEVEDDASRVISYTYDNDDLIGFTNAESEETVYAYDIPGRMSQMFLPENPAAAIFTNTFDALGRVMEQEDAFTNVTQFFIAGARSEVVNAENESQISYFNRHGAPIKDINGVANVRTQEFDALGRMIKQTLPEGNYVTIEYDTNGNVLSRTFTPKSGSGESPIAVSFTYDLDWNKVATATDGNGEVTTYTYDATTGQLLTIERPEVNSQISTETFTYTNRGQIETRLDPTGILTEYQYDSVTENLETVIVNSGVGQLNLTTLYGYNAAGDITSMTDPRGNATTFTFDAERRRLSKTDPSPLSYVTQWVYDDNGNILEFKRQTGDVGDPWQTVTMTYDADNKLKTREDALGHVREITYDGARRTWKIEDEVSRITEFAYDNAGRLQTVTDPDNNVVETRAYTDNGKLASQTDARSKTTSYAYDGHDRLELTTFADSTTQEITSYDDNGNVLEMETRAGNAIVMTYDELNRLKTKEPYGQAEVTYTYDLSGRLKTVSTSAVGGNPSSGEFEYFYDTAGRLVHEEYPDGKDVLFDLDENGNVIKLTYPDSYYVERQYDELNRLTGVFLNGNTTAAAEIAYDDLSRRETLTFENSVVTEYGFEKNDVIESLEHTFNGSGVTFTFDHNAAHEMIEQEVSNSAFMWHPGAGGTTTYATAGDTNTYPTVGGISYTYNGNRCLTGDGVWTFGYDTEDRLLSANDGSSTAVAYVYDPHHRQGQKTVNSTTKTRYVYAGWQRIADYNGSNDTLICRYVYGDNPDDILIKVASNGDKTYYHANHQGSVVALTNSSGAVTNTYKYSPFGESNSLSGTSHGFTGQRFDSETGLYYFKNRYYSAKIGRFLQPDPKGYADGLNLYAYVRNNPLTLTDPFGTEAVAAHNKCVANTIANSHSIVAAEANCQSNPQGNWLGVNDCGCGCVGEVGMAGGMGASVQAASEGMEPLLFSLPQISMPAPFSTDPVSVRPINADAADVFLRCVVLLIGRLVACGNNEACQRQAVSWFYEICINSPGLTQTGRPRG